jgi:hypothetical protein
MQQNKKPFVGMRVQLKKQRVALVRVVFSSSLAHLVKLWKCLQLQKWLQQRLPLLLQQQQNVQQLLRCSYPLRLLLHLVRQRPAVLLARLVCVVLVDVVHLRVLAVVIQA